MQIWLDSIHLEFIVAAQKLGTISGVTTNPSLLAAAKNVKHTLEAILEVQPGLVAVQVVAEDVSGMIDEAQRLFAFSQRLIVKIPVNINGILAMRQLKEQKIPFLATGVISPAQALLAARHEAMFIAPYFSHMGDSGNSRGSLQTIQNILKMNSYPSKLLVASLRHIEDIVFCAEIGVDAVTLKEDLYSTWTADSEALEKIAHKFRTDWQRVHGNAGFKDLL